MAFNGYSVIIVIVNGISVKHVKRGKIQEGMIKSMGKNYMKKLILFICCLSLLTGCGKKAVEPKDNNEGIIPEKTEAFGLYSPDIKIDENDVQTTRWDCIWFGSYPQGRAYTDNELKKSDGWNWEPYNEKIIGENKYRRLRKEDSTYEHNDEAKTLWESSEDDYLCFIYEPVKWRILAIDGDKALLLAENILDCQCYNEDADNGITWEESTVRSWLNGYGADSNKSRKDFSEINFIDNAFTESEQAAIIETNVKNKEKNGNDTKDKVFLLSETEVYTENGQAYGFDYFSNSFDEGRRAAASLFARAMGTGWGTIDEEGIAEECIGNSSWLLRTSQTVDSAGYIDVDNGCLNEQETDFAPNYGIRPAIVIDLSKVDCYSYAGTVCSDGTVKEETYKKPKDSEKENIETNGENHVKNEEGTAITNEDKVVENNWKETYKQYLLDFEKDNSGAEYRFCFEYIDEDNLPEIIIFYGDASADGGNVFQYISGEFKEINCYGTYGCFDFVERGNLIKSELSNEGYLTYEFYQLQQGKDNNLISFWNNCGAVTSESEQIYKVNDNVVSAEEYSGELHKINSGKTYKTVSYEECSLITESNIDSLLADLADYN